MASEERFYLRCEQKGQPDMYLHYDPYKDAYVVGATVTNACIITKAQIPFWQKQLGPLWVPVPIDMTNVEVIKLPRA